MMAWALVSAFVAWNFLYIAMDRPYQERFMHGKNKPRQTLLRIIGGLFLILSLSCCMHLWGYPIGFAAWWILLATSAFTFTMLQTFWPRHVLFLILTASVLAGLHSLVT